MHDMSSHRNGLFVMRRLLSTTNLYLSPLKQDWSHSVPTLYCTSVYSPRPSQTTPWSSPGSSRCPTREEDRVTTRHNNQTVSRHDMAPYKTRLPPPAPCPCPAWRTTPCPSARAPPAAGPQPCASPAPRAGSAAGSQPWQKYLGIVTKIFVYLNTCCSLAPSPSAGTA